MSRIAISVLALALAGTAAAQDEKAKAEGPAALERDCLAGNALACSTLAHQYREGDGVTEDIARSAILFFRACVEGAPSEKDCYHAGAMLVLARESAEDRPRLIKAIAAVRESCEAGALRDCNVLAFLYMAGKAPTIPQDMARGVELYARACDGGIASGCGNLADAHAAGNGTPRNGRKAVALYDKACGGGYLSGCVDAGEMYATGEDGAEKNLVLASRMFKRACDSRILRGCNGLAQIYQRDPVAARALFKQACGGDREQCADFEAFVQGMEAGAAFKRR